MNNMTNPITESLSTAIQSHNNDQLLQIIASLTTLDNPEAVKYFLNGGPEESSLLYLAIVAKNYTVIEFLLSQPDVDVNKGYYNKFAPYMMSDDVSVDSINREFLVTNDYESMTPLFLAVRMQDSKSIRLLLDHPNINIFLGYCRGSKVNNKPPLEEALTV